MHDPQPESETHVFVTMGDLTNVQCDAWLLPVGRGYHVRDYWLAAGEGLQEAVDARKSEDFSQTRVRAIALEDWPADRPTPIMTSITGLNLPGEKGLTALRQSVSAFVDVAAAHIRAHRTVAFQHRSLPLIGMPLIGTEGGGATKQRGVIVEAVLEAAAVAGRKNGVDIVLVLKDTKSFALAQTLRRANAVWPGLEVGSPLMNHVEALAAKAQNDRLVPFMGAGVSMSAGAPSWGGLIAALARGVDLSPEETASLGYNNRNALDQAAFLRHAYEARRPNPTEADGGFVEAIIKAVALPRYGLAPSLLASLNTTQAITLNYDDLYEKAYRDAGGELTVIPGRTAESTDNWLLKLHGSVDEPSSIVLTRDDYLGYSANREALAAIVKANLITHHIMFVGFGLVDDHFHQIIHDVRRAIPAERHDSGAFATALVLREDPLDSALWKGQLALINVGNVGDGDLQNGRRLEIFLDALLAHATNSHSYLLDEKFAGGLTATDVLLRDRILHFAEEISTDEKANSAAWPVVEKMLRELGQAGGHAVSLDQKLS
jgi:hypothetical protein